MPSARAPYILDVRYSWWNRSTNKCNPIKFLSSIFCESTIINNKLYLCINKTLFHMEKHNMKNILLIASLSLCMTNVLGQGKIYFEENFENNGSSIPNGWNQEYPNLERKQDWIIQKGGPKPSGATENVPNAAYNGDYNALFFKRTNQGSFQTYLVTPEIDFEFAQKPLLSFAYSQFQSRLSTSTPADNFEFSLCYRLNDSENTDWRIIKTFNGYTDKLNPWKTDSIYLPDSLKGARQVQFSFLGKSKTLGYGTCLDAIKIEETAIIQKYIDNVFASQPNQNIVPTGSTDNPILRLRMPVQGNDGKLLLQNLTVTILQQTESVVPQNGVKLYATEGESFNTTTLLGTTSITNGKAVFSNIDYDMPSGNSYIWIACDIKEDSEHRYRNYKIDMKIEKNDIKINGTLYPIAELNPSGVRIVNESILFDDFENGFSKWDFTGRFEHGIPNPNDDQLPSAGNPDPTSAHSGQYVIGTVLSDDGIYEHNLDTNGYSAISISLNCHYYKDISLLFYRWINKHFNDIATISASIDDGDTWKDIWNNTVYIAENDWTFQNFNLSSLLDRCQNVKIRFGLGPTGNSGTYTGWNIDDVALVGTFVYVDASISRIVAPVDLSCGFTDKEPITINIKNAGYNDITTPFTVSYSLDNGENWITETINRGLARDEEFEYTFQNLADLSEYGYHNIIAKIDLDDDEDSRNNSIQKTILSLPLKSIPYTEDFEATNGYWTGYGANNTWKYGKPNGKIISSTFSGTHCWSTAINGNYQSNDSAWLESPCFDFTNIQKPIIDFMLKSNAAPTDGLVLLYSIDNGNQWKPVSETAVYERFNWYNSSSVINAFGTKGWNGNFGWKHMQQLLPNDIAGQNSVKFRFVFASKETEGYEGFAIDDIKIYESPVDAGVYEIVNPISSCELSKEQPITISIKNYGNRAITSSDSLVASITINENTTLTDTFFVSSNLSIGETANFTFKQKVNMWNKKTYNMVATTKIKGDTLMFNAKNDNTTNNQISSSASVLGEPLYTLGPDIGTTQPETFSLDGGVQSNGKKFTAYEWKDNHDIVVGHERVLNGLNEFENDEKRYSYKIKVTNEHNCHAYDTIDIINSNTDIGISEIKNLPTSFCNSHDFTDITVTVKNMSPAFSLESGEKISICYSMLDADNNLITYSEDTILENVLLKGYSFDYKLKRQPLFEFDGEQNISFFTLITADINHNNDTIKQKVTVWSLPKADIAEDSILIGNPIGTILSIEPIENATYKWQGETGENTFIVTDSTSQLYTVNVTDLHNCATVSDSVRIITDNFSLKQIISPINHCEPQDEDEITILLTNNSTNTYNAGYSIPASITINGSTIKENIVLESELKAHSDLTYTFKNKINMASIGTYKLSVKVNPKHDTNPSDNTIFEDVNIWGVKQVSIDRDTIFSKHASGTLVDAGSGFESYLWVGKPTFNSSTTPNNGQTFNIPSDISAMYIVTVTDFNGCPSSSDTVTVVANDLGIDEIYEPKAACQVAELNMTKFKIHNYGNDVIPDSTIIPFCIKIDNNTINKCDFMLPSALESGKTMQASMKFQSNFDESTDHSFTMWIDWPIDHYTENDTANIVVHQYPHPDSFSLGDDIYTTKADTLTISAPSGYATYLWNDKTPGNTFNVSANNTAKYWVQVTNEYGCATYDTLSVITYDLGLDIIGGAINSCNIAQDVEVVGKVSVLSNDIIPSGLNFTASFAINGISKDTTIITDKDITTKDTFSFSFGQNIDLLEIGNYIVNSNLIVNNLQEADPFNNKSTNIRIGAYPLPFSDTIKVYDERLYTIDASDLFNKFDWINENNHDEQTITVSESRMYTLQATDTNGCKTKDSTYIMFINPEYDITGIGFPSSKCENTEYSVISFYLKNTGNDIIASGSQANISYTIDGKTTNEIYTFNNTLKPSDSTLVSFAKEADFRAPGTYSIVLNADIAGHKASGVFSVNTMENPSVSLGEDISSLEPTVTITPGTNYNSFLWNTGERTSSINVTNDGNYWVTVSNSYGCTKTDTVYVHFIPATITITEMKNPKPKCDSFNEESIDISILNNGQKTIFSNQTIGIKCIIDNNTIISDKIQLPIDFTPNALYNHSMSDPLNINSVGIHTLKFYIDIDGQLQDSSSFSTELYGSTDFDFESDIIKVDEYPYTLTTSTTLSNVNYLWDSGETTSSIEINNNGTYSLTITNSNGCQSSRNVTIEKNSSDTTSVEPSEFVLNNIALYPNPANHILNIDFQGEYTKNNKILIANTKGQIIFASEQTSDIMTINVSDWTKGVYFIKITNNNNSVIRKFVIE